MSYFDQIKSKYAKAISKEGLTFHLYVDFEGDATVCYAPSEKDTFVDSWGENPQHPSDIVYQPIPSELLIFDGKENDCKRWLTNKNTNAHALALAVLKRLSAGENWALEHYLNNDDFRPYNLELL